MFFAPPPPVASHVATRSKVLEYEHPDDPIIKIGDQYFSLKQLGPAIVQSYSQGCVQPVLQSAVQEFSRVASPFDPGAGKSEVT